MLRENGLYVGETQGLDDDLAWIKRWGGSCRVRHRAPVREWDWKAWAGEIGKQDGEMEDAQVQKANLGHPAQQRVLAWGRDASGGFGDI
jgi:hypothetical protein